MVWKGDRMKTEKEIALCKGIGILFEMEKNIYMSRLLYHNLENVINGMDFNSQLKPPSRPKPPQILVFEKSSNNDIPSFFIFGTIIWGIAFAIFTGITLSMVAGFWLGILAAIIGLMILYWFNEHRDKEEIEEINFKRQRQYENECERYKKEYEGYLVKVEKEKKEISIRLNKKEALIIYQRKIKENYQKSKEHIEELYDLMKIDKRFRNIVPMGYMQEFSELGISTQLEGPNGLYYLILQELRWDQMQYTVEEISRNLRSLINQNRKIYSVLCSIESEIASVARDICSIKEVSKDQMDALSEIENSEKLNSQYNLRIMEEEKFRNEMYVISEFFHS